MTSWPGRRVVVTGGRGFLGRRVCDRLAAAGADVVAVRSADYDLTVEERVAALYADTRPDVVIHLAARVGGIEANRKAPGTFFYASLQMGALLIEYARRSGLQKFVCIGTVCSYPKFTPVPFKESDLWNGYPEETNAPYGVAKKALLTQLQAYRDEFGLNGIYLIPVNLYGPGDNFDLETSHVIPALIRKCVEAADSAQNEVAVWGSGRATREFLYVEDAADGIVMASERYDKADPVNLGSGIEISIRDLAGLIGQITGFDGTFVWDGSKPDGQPRRRLDTSRARAEFGWQAGTPLREGLETTVRWYREQLAASPKRAAR